MSTNLPINQHFGCQIYSKLYHSPLVYTYISFLTGICFLASSLSPVPSDIDHSANSENETSSTRDSCPNLLFAITRIIQNRTLRTETCTHLKINKTRTCHPKAKLSACHHLISLQDSTDHMRQRLPLGVKHPRPLQGVAQ